MAGIPYYKITNCCDAGDEIIVNIDLITPPPFVDGVYKYTGPGFSLSGMTFVTNNCYYISLLGLVLNSYPFITNSEWQNFTFTSADKERGCLECIDCSPPSFCKLVYRSCCDPTIEYSTQGTLPFGTFNRIIRFNNPYGNIPAGCYIVSTECDITPEEYGSLPSEPAFGQYTILTSNPILNDCDYYRRDGECPECEDPQCYGLVNCDGLYFFTTENLSAYVGQFIEINDYEGTWYVFLETGPCNDARVAVDVIGIAEPCPCICYEIVGRLNSLEYVNCDNEIVKDATATQFCSRIYPIFSGTPGEYQILQGEECVDGECPIVCYVLENCDTGEIIYSNLQSLYRYLNTNSVVTLLGYEGCWEVKECIPDCDCITVTIGIDNEGIIIYTEYTALNIGTYNGWGVWEFTIDSDTFYIWNSYNNPGSNWTISEGSYGATPGVIYAASKLVNECPEADSGNQTGNPNDWFINFSTPEVSWRSVKTEICPCICECPVDVVVIQEFDSCEACEPIVAYKLRNCENTFDVQYTTQDLSAYVDQVVQTDCGCFIVEEIDYIPPSTTVVVIEYAFENCKDCLSTFYLLTDCAGEVDDIVTTTDLSDYIGQVIKLENCDTCWEVSETREFTILSNVVIAESYIDCIECFLDVPCVCSKITNLTSIERTIEYYDCDDVLQEITLEVGESSEKICLKRWMLPDLPPNEILYTEFFGECKNGVCPQPIFKNDRIIKPGYITPVCTPEKYTEITCKFADIIYKIALEKRYGITNCCPDEDDQWLVEKELIDLQALHPPTPVCPAPSSCIVSTIYTTFKAI